MWWASAHHLFLSLGRLIMENIEEKKVDGEKAVKAPDPKPVVAVAPKPVVAVKPAQKNNVAIAADRKSARRGSKSVVKLLR